MYNSKRFETVKNMRENKKISNAVQAAIGVLAVVLAALIVWMMVLVSGIQGTARVVNYAGLVRGETQRLVKMEIAGQAEDGMMESVESFINGMRFGDDELTLVRLDDMSIVKELIEKKNGTITVESVLGEGSAFTVTLPFEIDKHPFAQAAANGAADETALHGLKVLLAEDNELNMEIAEFFLEDMGAETMQAWNGKEAVEAFRNSAPDEIGVILMDIMMPVMDGLEAVQRIRALDRPDAKTVPIIAMTANAFSEDVERSRKAGMTEHLSKPLNAETLKKAILRNI